MLYILAILIPGLAVILSGRIGLGILLFILHATIVGWIPASIIAVLIVRDQENKKIAERRLP
jgi:TM2 domain-containing membrane protein YozV